MDEPAARRNDPATEPDAALPRTGWVDEKVLASPEASSMRPTPNGSVPTDYDNGRAIDALRAATTAAGDNAAQPSIDDIAQIRRLHEMRMEAEHRSRRALLKPGHRRKVEYALTAETAALRMIGFGSFEAFSAVYGGTASTDNSAAESAETIARIQELLTELGVDPHGDPLRAASEFLTTHETGTTETALAPASQLDAERELEHELDAFGSVAPAEAIAMPVVEHLDITDDEPRIAPDADIDAHAFSLDDDSTVPMPESDAPAVELPAVGAAHAPENDAPAVAADFEAVVEETEAEPEPELTPAGAADAESALELEPEAPWVPAAQLPPVNPDEIRKNDDDVLDRWIHAEARAERMHAEVDRAQAELVAMLARSADLERTVVNRADELDNANADLEAANHELERVRERVEDLERSIVRSDTERDDLERALTTSRDRVADLEARLQDRELAFTEAAGERASALEQAADLEMTLATRTAELEEARTSVSELEAQLASQAAHLDHTTGELGAVRANAEELTTELETTRRALDALDSHAEAIEAELAEARRAADNPEVRAELEAVRRELTEARHELGHLEFQRAETDRSLAQDRIELQQLQHTLATTRDDAIVVLDELTEARRAVEQTTAQAEDAERARQAITIDAADLLARAEAEATSMLERANRDAESIRQKAALSTGVGLGADLYGRGSDAATFGDDTLGHIIERIERLERKLAKQRRRLDQIAKTGRTPERKTSATNLETAKTEAPKRAAVEELVQLITVAGSDAGLAATPARAGEGDLGAAAVIAAAQREAEDIRRAARREREQFRTDLVALLSRLAPIAEDDDDEDDDW